tara:strand:+ start:19816 stop:20694 length:879 start_codon:yes stop_codon:yes gene_type:complete
MSWYELSVSSQKTDVDRITALLESQGALAVSYFDAEDQPILEPKPNEVNLWEKVITTGLFPMTLNPDSLATHINQDFPSCLISHKILPDQDWTTTWLEHFKPIQFNQKFWICPSGFDSSSLQGEVLHLDPGLAFGTGQHPTTRLCLHWLASQEINQKTILDFGCGTGILALAALKLGAKQCYGIDHDPQALYSTRLNAKKNHIAPEQLPILSDDVNEVPACDVIMANILMRPLIELAPLLQKLCLPNGYLVLSGILKSQVSELKEAYIKWFEFAPYCLDDEDWVLLVGKRKI